MREILFRGKRIDNGNWVNGVPWKALNGSGWYLFQVTEIAGAERMIHVKVDPATVGQYTGLTDKNGKKIFEGDIVRFKTRTSTFKPLYVRWYEETAQFLVSKRDGVRSYPMDKSWEYEIIGNIHDNPELLEGGADR